MCTKRNHCMACISISNPLSNPSLGSAKVNSVAFINLFSARQQILRLFNICRTQCYAAISLIGDIAGWHHFSTAYTHKKPSRMFIPLVAATFNTCILHVYFWSMLRSPTNGECRVPNKQSSKDWIILWRKKISILRTCPDNGIVMKWISFQRLNQLLIL